MLPAEVQGELSSGNQLSAGTIATAFALYKQVLGPHGVALQSPEEFAKKAMQKSQEVDDHKNAIQNLLNKVNEVDQIGRKKKVRYLDDKALYDDAHPRI